MYLVILNLDSEFRIHRQILSNFPKSTLVARDVIEVDHTRGQHFVVHYQNIELKIKKQKILDCHLDQSWVETPNLIELVNVDVDSFCFISL
jgi:hypothetical protein